MTEFLFIEVELTRQSREYFWEKNKLNNYFNAK